MEIGIPAADLSRVVGIESMFHRGPYDPWANSLLAEFVDYIVYSDAMRFLIPVSNPVDSSNEVEGVPLLMQELMKEESGLVIIEPCIFQRDEGFNPDYLMEAYSAFSTWARTNKGNLLRWLTLHRQPWIREKHDIRVRGGYVYDLERLVEMTEKFLELRRTLDMKSIQEKDLRYGFDMFLRYVRYGAQAGDGTNYLSHPVRTQPNLPTKSITPVESPDFPVRFGPSIAAIAENISMKDLAMILCKVRYEVRQDIINMKRGTVGRDRLRDLARKLELPPKLRSQGKCFTVIGGILSIAGIWIGPIAPLVGGAVAISSALWSGTLPPGVVKLKWLHPVYEWDLEKESSASNSD